MPLDAPPTHVAAAAEPYEPVRAAGGAPLNAEALHVVRRWTYGYTPALAEEVAAAGGHARWFEQQLHPERIADAEADALRSWWPSLDRAPLDLWERQVSGAELGWRVMADYGRWLMMRRMTSHRQVAEIMTEFWEALLHVPVNGDAQFVHRAAYGRAVRAHALGTFADLLKAAVLHPAMGIFLDNAVSTKTKPNENLGRELLELHTVGRGNHTEDDVKSSARILTGYRVDVWRTWAATYNPNDHWTGPVDAVGFRHANSDPDGRAVAEAYLDHLARHPSTARRICRRLAVKFVRDDPPSSLVERLARVWVASGTHIPAVLRELVASPEFAAARGTKLRDSVEDVVATYRALGAIPQRSTGDNAAVSQMLWQTNAIGGMPLAWPRPDGPPIDNASWSSSSRALASFSVHWNLAGRAWPREAITYRQPVEWLPDPQVSFAELVDHVCVQLLGQVSTPTVLQACCEAANCQPSTLIDADHNLVRWNFARLIGTLLDTPAHLTR